ncbi:hypothetical protein BU24DRAFT_479578 [Aaosphaeria arxii CBS 175.79]|uniref:Uncharacterized protein n=1 Tax=Aaosphaeria arxii CBS 175.79 TaxID=1450172 RepID=A0A6A5Y0V8_9PLEO|nr:uncharacterized protein BU24DRAFT_479578 [Aaosphaeria arxii CBS 175.79]KAF2018194.1 hypothetical protein BU24DRAFT_479578 [Aaosphaeria arxii CBS 175.79]
MKWYKLKLSRRGRRAVSNAESEPDTSSNNRAGQAVQVTDKQEEGETSIESVPEVRNYATFFDLPPELRDQIYDHLWNDSCIVHEQKAENIQILILYGAETQHYYAGLPSWINLSDRFRDECLGQLNRAGRLTIAEDILVPPGYGGNWYKTDGELTVETLRRMTTWDIKKLQLNWRLQHSNKPCYLEGRHYPEYDPECCKDYLRLYFKNSGAIVDKLRWLKGKGVVPKRIPINIVFQPDYAWVLGLFLSGRVDEEDILYDLEVLSALPQQFDRLEIRLSGSLYFGESSESEEETNSNSDSLEMDGYDLAWKQVHREFYRKCWRLVTNQFVETMKELTNEEEEEVNIRCCESGNSGLDKDAIWNMVIEGQNLS